MSGSNDLYQWRGDLGGSTEQQYLRNVYNNAGRAINQFSDFNSPFYQQYASYLNKAIPGVGTNDFLPTLASGGGNYGGSMAQALALKGNATRKRQDLINTGVGAFASQNVSMISQLLGIQGNVAGLDWQGQTQRDISSEQQGGALDFLAAPTGAFAGAFGAEWATSLFAAAPAAAAASDIRLKENIYYTGEKTADGIPVAEFNFIGDGTICRGVIAQDVERIRPDAVTEINGYKHVYYGAL